MMDLRKNDQRQLEKRLKNPEFERLFTELIFLKARRYPDLVVTCFPIDGSGPNGSITPGDLEDGFTTRIVVAQSQQIPLELAQKLAVKLREEATSLAVKLASYFPMRNRWQWLMFFSTMAINEQGIQIQQNQRGGAPKGMSDKTKERYKAIVDMYYKSDLTQTEFCREMNISRGKLNRAIKFVSENRQ